MVAYLKAIKTQAKYFNSGFSGRKNCFDSYPNSGLVSSHKKLVPDNRFLVSYKRKKWDIHSIRKGRGTESRYLLAFLFCFSSLPWQLDDKL